MRRLIPLKKLIFTNLSISYVYSSGRNNQGKITRQNRYGGNHKVRFRLIDMIRPYYYLPACIIRIEKDPLRSAYVALICYSSGLLSYIIAPHKLKHGDFLQLSTQSNLRIGNKIHLQMVSEGMLIHNIMPKPDQYSQIARAAGTKAMLLRHLGDYALVRIPSGEIRYMLVSNFATIGTISHTQHKYTNKPLKAGELYRRGRKPRVRGIAMNPVDHPHGGGHGKTSTGRAPVSPWGKLTKGTKTRCKTKNLFYLFKARKRKRKKK